MSSLDRRHLALAVVGAAVALALPFVLDGSWTYLFVQGAQQTLVVLSVIVLYRAARAVSLCQSAFVGIAAFAMSWLMTTHGWPFAVAFVVAPMVTVAVGAVLALPVLRFRGVELSIITLIVGLAANALVFSTSAPLRVADFGASIPDNEILGIDLTGTTAAYFVSVVVAALAYLAVTRVLSSSVGRTWTALEAGNAVAASCGISITRAKFVGFALSAGLAGLAGVLFIGVQTSVDPSSFAPAQSLAVVIGAMLAGIDRPSSAVIGGLAVTVGRRIPVEFGIDADYLNVALGLLVLFAILSSARVRQVRTGG